ncbi:MAG: type II toxin-antitoxin system death-on-curing family toxin [Bacteroidetes bacterium]|jgi:death-on-curing protein|nr:type II toxin-antitoxin system death-on-curing family toxin [Bacteroidota bacterium]
MAHPDWLEAAEVEAIQEQVVYPGERPGYLGSRGVLLSALNRPQNHYHYEGVESLYELAALYCIAITKCHAFENGNKRTAVVSAAYFLAKNGIDFDPDDTAPASADMIIRATTDEIDYRALAAWIEENSTEQPAP